MAVQFDPTALLNLVFWGDPQVTTLLHPERRQRFEAACRAVRDAEGHADAVLIAGDIAEFGREADYAAAGEALRYAAQNADSILVSSGNHDVRIRPFRFQHRRFRAFLSTVPKAVQTPYGRYWYEYEIKGYPFIVLGADRNSFEAVWFKKEQLRFLDDALARAEAAGKPAFVLNHQPLRRTNGLPLTWEGRGSWRGSVGLQSGRVREILSSHGTVFYLTGHLHYGVSEHNVQSLGRLHMLCAPTVGCDNHGPGNTPAQGYVLRLYPDRLQGTAYNFAAAEPLDENITNASFEIKSFV